MSMIPPILTPLDPNTMTHIVNHHRLSPSHTAPTDFIQKLFKLVNDPSSHPLAQWSSPGDSFLITDPHDFAKILLPMHFKHNNFQSFIRQLNKYGFNKVKRGGEDKVWEFKHENFNKDGEDLLKDIKRKAAVTKRVSVNSIDNEHLSPQPINANLNLNLIIQQLQSRIDNLERSNNQNKMIIEMSKLKEMVYQHDGILKKVVECIVSQEKALMLFVDNRWSQDFNPPSNFDPNLPAQPPQFSQNVQQLVNSYKQLSKVSNQFLNEFNQNNNSVIINDNNNNDFYNNNNQYQNDNLNNNNSNNNNNNYLSTNQVNESQNIITNENQVFDPTQQFYNYNLLPYQKDLNEIKLDNNNNINTTITNINNKPLIKQSAKRKAFAEKRAKMNHPNNNNNQQQQQQSSLPWTWIVPPNVLLVDDDPTCQAIYAKSLQILGCSYDIAADGIEAVSRMKSRKYDMVLMDIWMPEMDGLSATKLIRQFDPITPIIAITGDYREQDRDFYLDQGINEVLGKPLKVKELGPIMQKHWLKFCINRGTNTLDNSNTNNLEFNNNNSTFIQNSNLSIQSQSNFNNNSNNNNNNNNNTSTASTTLPNIMFNNQSNYQSQFYTSQPPH